MKLLELFAGTRSVSKAFEKRGHQTYSIEWDKSFPDISLYADVLTVTADQILRDFGRPDVIWASPDCSTYSIAAISHHRRKEENGNLAAVSDYAKFCDRVNLHVHGLIMTLSPRLWFIENPRGGMRKMEWMQGLPRYTVTYCQYGDTRMKPTDIWSNYPDPQFKPPCHNGDPCHISAPRGAKTGTQGLKGGRERAVIPEALCDHIVDICEMELLEGNDVIPLEGWSEKGSDTLDNMLPACRSCNHYKSRSTLDGFRRMVENMPSALMRDSVTYRNAVRFGLVTPTPHPIIFYFERRPPEGEEEA